MDTEKILLETIGIMQENARRTDEINKRLITTQRLTVLAFLTAAVICFAILYLSDYTTTEVTQQQQQQMSDSQMQQQQ